MPITTTKTADQGLKPVPVPVPVGKAMDAVTAAIETRQGDAALAQMEAAPVCLPGQRLVDGRPYTFNQDALNLHLARERVALAPADLRPVSDGALSSLLYAALRIDAEARGHDEAMVDLMCRITAERKRREAK